MAEYRTAPKMIVDLVNEVIAEHHEDLMEARVGVLLRDVAPMKGEMRVMGKARKITPEEQALLPFDFLIWFSHDVWVGLSDLQRRALVDHELQHCYLTEDGDPKIRQHDFEEFTVIIERYGFWWPRSEEAKHAVQTAFGFVSVGEPGVVAVEQDVIEQVGNLFSEEEANGKRA